MKKSRLHLNTIALEPNRWSRDKTPVFDLATLLPPIAAADFRYVELWEGHIARLDAEQIAAAQALAEKTGLELTIAGLYPKLHLDGDQAAQEFARISNLMRSAKRLGSRTIKFFVGSIASATCTTRELDLSIGFLHQLRETANREALVLAGEFHANTLFDTIESTQKLLSLIEGLKICFQPFNFGSTEQTLADLRTLAPEVVHFHLQGRREGQFSTLERADIDYAAVLSLLAETGYTGDFGIEFVKGCVVDTVDESYLRRVLDAAAVDADYFRTVAASTGLQLEG